MEPISSIKTSLSLGDALVTSAIGFSIVFFVLLILMCVINILRALASKLDAGSDSTAPVPVLAPAAPKANMVPAPGSLGEIKLHDVDDQTAAILMAIVADELKAPLNELRFISIRERK